MRTASLAHWRDSPTAANRSGDSISGRATRKTCYRTGDTASTRGGELTPHGQGSVPFARQRSAMPNRTTLVRIGSTCTKVETRIEPRYAHACGAPPIIDGPKWCNGARRLSRIAPPCRREPSAINDRSRASTKGRNWHASGNSGRAEESAGRYSDSPIETTGRPPSWAISRMSSVIFIEQYFGPHMLQK